MADVTVEFGATDTGLDKTLQGIRDSMKNLETQQKTTAMSTDEVERSLRELKKLQGMEKHFMDLAGETKKLSESQIEAERSSQELAAAMKKAEAETRALAEEQKKADAITKANRTATEIYNQEIEELQKHLAAGRISMDTFATATAKAEKNLSAASPQAKDLGNNIKDVGDKTKKIGGIFDDEFKRMGAAFTIGNLAAEGFQKAISLAFDAARAVVRGFSDALDLGGRLSELSTRTGEAAGKLLVLETAFKNSGLEASQVGAVINKLQNFMQDAANGGEKQTKVMRDLGITMADLAGKTPSEQMEVFAKKIAAIEDPTQRAATASEVFGEKLGGKLLPLLVDFSGNIEDARSKVGSLEQVMNENADTFDKFSESIDAIKGKMAAFAAGVLSETVPALQELGSEMEGVDAAKIGQEIGTILNPALSGSATILKDVTGEYGDYYNAVQSASMGNVDVANSSKDATGMFDLLKVMMVSITGPISDLISGTTDYTDAANAQQDAIKKSGDASSSAADNIKNLSDSSSDATNEMNGVATAANNASPALATIGNQAVDTGAKINTAFTLTADLKPELDSIGSGWGDISDKIQTGNSLLEGTGAAFGAIAQRTEEQAAGIGGINEQLTASEALNKLILDLVGKTADKEADAAVKAAQKAADQEKANALKQAELKFQLDITEAQADGDTDRIEALKAEKKYAEDLQKAIDAGLDPLQAEKFANNMLKAASGISATAREADRVKNSLATKIGEDIKKRQDAEAVDPGGRLMKKAQEQIAAGRYTSAETTMRQIKDREADANIRGTGKGRDTRALDDIGRQDYGIRRDFGESQSDFRERIRLAREEGQYKKEANENMKKSLASTQKRMGEGMKKEAEKKVEENKTPMTLEGMVKAIQTAVEKLEMKLPQPVMV